MKLPGSVLKAAIAVVLTAAAIIAVVQFSAPSARAQTVSLYNVPSTVVEQKTYSFYVTVNLQGIAKIYPDSLVTLNIFKSNGALATYGQFNGTGVIINSGTFIKSVTIHNGTPTNIYGYGGTTGYFSYQVYVVFLSGGVLTPGQYTMNATLKINSTTPAISSSPVAFKLVKAPVTSNFLIIFIVVDVIVIAIIVWVVISVYRRRR